MCFQRQYWRAFEQRFLPWKNNKYYIFLVCVCTLSYPAGKAYTPCYCNWRTFGWKNSAGRSPRGSCSCTTMSQLTGHLQPRRNWPTWASSVLITHPILRICLRRTTTCSMDWKNNWNVAIFHPTRRSLLPRRSGWTDSLLNVFFLSGFQKLQQRAK